jgi:DNA-binding transcriptional MerR regulator
MGSQQPIRKTVAPEIPDKLYFRIGDVAKLCDVPAYVLRFWETEFPQLKPNKGGTGQRLYRKRDVEMVLRVKSLLYDQGFTIPGARQILKGEPRSSAAVEPATLEPAPASRTSELKPARTAHQASQLQSIRNELQALLGILSHPASPASMGAAASATAAKVKTMRPRLTLEPRPRPVTAAPAELPRPMLLQLAQRDLFAPEKTMPDDSTPEDIVTDAPEPNTTA